MKTGIIYKHVNKLNNKVYIGSTIQSANRRWRKSDNTFASYKQCSAFYNALKAHGWDSFESSVLEELVPIDKLNEREEFYITYYNSLAPNGYNLNNLINDTHQLSLETRMKISKKAKKFKKRTPKNKNNHILINEIWHKKCPKCEETKQLTEYNKYKKTWDGFYRLCRSCQNKQQSEYHKLNKITLSKEELAKSYQTRGTYDKSIKGIHIETGEIIEFKSGSSACKMGFDKTSIRRNILKNRPYKNYIWSYVDSNQIKIRASRCEIKEVSTKEERDFLNLNHKQKYIASSWSYGLYYENRLVCLLTMGKPRFNKNYEWEIIRLCTEKNTVVHGGASRLFKFFIKYKNPRNVMTYATVGYSTGGKVYEKLGFKFVRSTASNYVYIKGDIVISRTQAQKKRLFKIIGEAYDSTKTELRNMLDNGYTKEYIAGSNVYEWKAT